MPEKLANELTDRRANLRGRAHQEKRTTVHRMSGNN